MPDYRKMFDKEYIGSWDLDGNDVTATIKDVKAGELAGQNGRKSKNPIVYFDGSAKGLVLNKTNSKTIAAMYGTLTEAWIGKSITMYPTKTEMAGETVDCIRIRPGVPS